MQTFRIKYYETGNGYIPDFSHSQICQASSREKVLDYVKQNKADGYGNPYLDCKPDGYNLRSKAGAVIVKQIELLQID
jgi:hypothetical protein